MHVSIIGTNGLLSNCIATYCNNKLFTVSMYGKTAPKSVTYTNYHTVNLVNDQLDYDLLCKSDLIIYAAGAGIQAGLNEKPDLIYHLNVMVPVQVCNNLKEANYKGTFISFGSYFEIGETAANIRFNETGLLQSQLKAPNNYSISKRMLSRFIGSFSAPFTFLHFILPTIYGETEANHRLIPYTINSVNKNIELKLTSGEQVRQYIYVNDVVKTLFKAVDANLTSGIYNVMCTEELTVKELVTMLFTLMGKTVPNDVFGKTDRADVGMKVLKLNSEKLQDVIGYLASTKIADVYTKYNFEQND